MSDIQRVKSAFRYLDTFTPDLLKAALIDAYRDVQIAVQERSTSQQACDVTHQQTDLFSRRCDLAVAICSNDEHGLTRETLDRIAAIIWPPIMGPLAAPTPAPQALSVSQLTTHICSAGYLLERSDGLLKVILEALPTGFVVGESLTKQITEWRQMVGLWRDGKEIPS